MTKQQLDEAREEFRSSSANVLFLLMLYQQGAVIRSRVVSHKLSDMRDTQVERRVVRRAQFTPACPAQREFPELFYSHIAVSSQIINLNRAEGDYVSSEHW